MKKVLALLMALLMAFALFACGKGDTSETTATADEVTTEAPLDTDPDPVTIGDCEVEFIGAEKYTPFEDGESLLVRFKFTNNGTLETSAFKELFITAKCGEERILEMAYQKEYTPEGYDNFEKPVAPGESIEILYILGYADGMVEVTLQDIHNKAPQKLVFGVDTKTLG